MLESPEGNVYLTDVEGSAIRLWDSATNSLEQVIADKRLLWPDTLSWDRTASFT